jgi:hypothetical protein
MSAVPLVRGCGKCNVLLAVLCMRDYALTSGNVRVRLFRRNINYTEERVSRKSCSRLPCELCVLKNYHIQASGSACKTGDLCLVSLTAKNVTSNMRYIVQLLSNYPDAYRPR